MIIRSTSTVPITIDPVRVDSCMTDSGPPVHAPVMLQSWGAPGHIMRYHDKLSIQNIQGHMLTHANGVPTDASQPGGQLWAKKPWVLAWRQRRWSKKRLGVAPLARLGAILAVKPPFPPFRRHSRRLGAQHPSRGASSAAPSSPSWPHYAAARRCEWSQSIDCGAQSIEWRESSR